MSYRDPTQPVDVAEERKLLQARYVANLRKQVEEKEKMMLKGTASRPMKPPASSSSNLNLGDQKKSFSEREVDKLQKQIVAEERKVQLLQRQLQEEEEEHVQRVGESKEYLKRLQIDNASIRMHIDCMEKKQYQLPQSVQSTKSSTAFLTTDWLRSTASAAGISVSKKSKSSYSEESAKITCKALVNSYSEDLGKSQFFSGDKHPSEEDFTKFNLLVRQLLVATSTDPLQQSCLSLTLSDDDSQQTVSSNSSSSKEKKKKKKQKKHKKDKKDKKKLHVQTKTPPPSPVDLVASAISELGGGSNSYEQHVNAVNNLYTSQIVETNSTLRISTPSSTIIQPPPANISFGDVKIVTPISDEVIQKCDAVLKVDSGFGTSCDIVLPSPSDVVFGNTLTTPLNEQIITINSSSDADSCGLCIPVPSSSMVLPEQEKMSSSSKQAGGGVAAVVRNNVLAPNEIGREVCLADADADWCGSQLKCEAVVHRDRNQRTGISERRKSASKRESVVELLRTVTADKKVSDVLSFLSATKSDEEKGARVSESDIAFASNHSVETLLSGNIIESDRKTLQFLSECISDEERGFYSTMKPVDKNSYRNQSKSLVSLLSEQSSDVDMTAILKFLLLSRSDIEKGDRTDVTDVAFLKLRAVESLMESTKDNNILETLRFLSECITDEEKGLISPNPSPPPSPRGRRDSHIETLMESTSNYAEKEVLDFLLKSRTEEEKGGERTDVTDIAFFKLKAVETLVESTNNSKDRGILQFLSECISDEEKGLATPLTSPRGGSDSRVELLSETTSNYEVKEVLQYLLKCRTEREKGSDRTDLTDIAFFKVRAVETLMKTTRDKSSLKVLRFLSECIGDEEKGLVTPKSSPPPSPRRRHESRIQSLVFSTSNYAEKEILEFLLKCQTEREKGSDRTDITDIAFFKVRAVETLMKTTRDKSSLKVLRFLSECIGDEEKGLTSPRDPPSPRGRRVSHIETLTETTSNYAEKEVLKFLLRSRAEEEKGQERTEVTDIAFLKLRAVESLMESTKDNNILETLRFLSECITDEEKGLISPNPSPPPSPRGRRDSHIETLMESTSNYAEKEVLDFLLKSRTEEEKGGERTDVTDIAFFKLKAVETLVESTNNSKDRGILQFLSECISDEEKGLATPLTSPRGGSDSRVELLSETTSNYEVKEVLQYLLKCRAEKEKGDRTDVTDVAFLKLRAVESLMESTKDNNILETLRFLSECITDEEKGLISPNPSPNPSPRGRRDSHIETLMESTSNYAEKEVLDFLLKSRTEEEKGGERTDVTDIAFFKLKAVETLVESTRDESTLTILRFLSECISDEEKGLDSVVNNSSKRKSSVVDDLCEASSDFRCQEILTFLMSTSRNQSQADSTFRTRVRAVEWLMRCTTDEKTKTTLRFLSECLSDEESTTDSNLQSNDSVAQLVANSIFKHTSEESITTILRFLIPKTLQLPPLCYSSEVQHMVSQISKSTSREVLREKMDALSLILSPKSEVLNEEISSSGKLLTEDDEVVRICSLISADPISHFCMLVAVSTQESLKYVAEKISKKSPSTPFLLYCSANGKVYFEVRTSGDPHAGSWLLRVSHHMDIEGWAVGTPTATSASAVAYEELDVDPPRTVLSICHRVSSISLRYACDQ